MLLILLAGAVVARAACEDLEGVPMEDLVRLHVVASDDTNAAQALKLQVRNAVLARARALLSDCAGADDAWRIICENAEGLAEAARDRAREEGFFGEVWAEAGVFDFPDRLYGGVLVPAGRYRALRVVIGAGEGRNWWCVLYPTLCLPEDHVPGEPVAFHSTILNWLHRIFGGDAP